MAQVLNNLTSPYKGFIIIVIQSYRTNSSNINLENLFSNLLDESRRQGSKDHKIALVTGRRPRPNQTNQIHKNKYYKKYKTTIYYIKDQCYKVYQDTPK